MRRIYTTIASILFLGQIACSQDVAKVDTSLVLPKASTPYEASQEKDEVSKNRLSLNYVVPDEYRNDQLAAIGETSQLLKKIQQVQIGGPILEEPDSTKNGGSSQKSDFEVYQLPDVVVYAERDKKRRFTLGPIGKISGNFGDQLIRDLDGINSKVDTSNFYVDDWRYETDQRYRNQIDEEVEDRWKDALQEHGREYIREIRKALKQGDGWLSRTYRKGDDFVDKGLDVRYKSKSNPDKKISFEGGTDSDGYLLEFKNVAGGEVKLGGYVTSGVEFGYERHINFRRGPPDENDWKLGVEADFDPYDNESKAEIKLIKSF